jgi:hypothetical protein
MCWELTNFEVVPIPEGVERDEEEPLEDSDFGALKNSGGNDVRSGGTGLGFGIASG